MLFKANKKDKDSDYKKSGKVRKIKFEGDTSEEVDDSRIEKKKEFNADALNDIDKLLTIKSKSSEIAEPYKQEDSYIQPSNVSQYNNDHTFL